MLQSQKLQVIEKLLLYNQAKEISFQKNESFEVKDTLNNTFFKIIRYKYIGFDILRGCIIKNLLEGKIAPIRKFVYIFFNINLYKKSWFTSYFWNSIENGVVIVTIFKIQNGKDFIDSLLDFIDEEKQNHILYDDKKSRDTLSKDIEHAKSEFSNTEFTLHYSLKDFISKPMQIYGYLKKIGNVYEIKNIQIFNGNINFYLTQIGEKKIKIEFNGESIFINNKKISFKKGGSFIEDYVRMLFSYFKATKKNEVTFVDLRRFYNEHKYYYKNIGENKFFYDNVRISIKTKSEEICEKHKIKGDFFKIGFSSISCPFYIAEEDTLSVSSVT